MRLTPYYRLNLQVRLPELYLLPLQHRRFSHAGQFAVKIKDVMRGINIALLLVLMPCMLAAQQIVLRGLVVDPQGNMLPDASVQLMGSGKVLSQTKSGPDGRFTLNVSSAGDLTIQVDASGFRSVIRTVDLRPGGNPELTITMSQLASRIENLTVTADVNESDVLSPDPGEKVFVRQDLLDANPGRPGAPVSIPGYPIETASGGIKAPQYFAPGVAGDHGEPIAQYILVGGFLLPKICPPTRTATATPIRIFSFPKFWKAFKSMVGRLMFGKGITRSIWRQPMPFALISIRSSR